MLLSYGDGLACSPTKWLQQLHIPMITIIVTTLTIFLSVLVNTDLDQEQKLDIKGLTDWLASPEGQKVNTLVTEQHWLPTLEAKGEIQYAPEMCAMFWRV